MGSEIKVNRDTFKKEISFWIHVKIRYENFHCSFIVGNMKKDCVLLEKKKKKNYGSFKGSSMCCVRYVPSDLKKVRKLERYITQRSIPVWGYISTGIAEIYSSSITGSDIHYRMLATIVLLTFLLKCCMMA